MKNNGNQQYEETRLEGRNAVREAFRAGRTVDKVYIQDGLRDAAIGQITAMAKKAGTIISYVKKEVLDSMSETKAHQGVIAQAAAVSYSTVEEMLEDAREEGKEPLLLILDEIEDPRNLGAMIRSANAAGAHGVIIPKHHAASLTASCAKTSAGAVNYTRVARVTNIASVLRKLKEEGFWIVGADMDGELYYNVPMKGPLAIVIGNEGRGIRPLVRGECDYIASIPLYGEIESLNASAAAALMLYEAVRQRL